jgi:hypothetical protein
MSFKQIPATYNENLAKLLTPGLRATSDVIVECVRFSAIVQYRWTIYVIVLSPAISPHQIFDKGLRKVMVL